MESFHFEIPKIPKKYCLAKYLQPATTEKKWNKIKKYKSNSEITLLSLSL